MCALSLTLKFLCTRYVSLSLKNILHALCVVSQSYVRALCLGIDKNYLCALGLVFAKIYMWRPCVVIDENCVRVLFIAEIYMRRLCVIIAKIYMHGLCHYH